MFQGKVVQLAVAGQQEMHLGAEGRPGFLGIEVAQMGAVGAVGQQASTEAVGQDARQGGLPHPDGPFDG